MSRNINKIITKFLAQVSEHKTRKAIKLLPNQKNSVFAIIMHKLLRYARDPPDT